MPALSKEEVAERILAVRRAKHRKGQDGYQGLSRRACVVWPGSGIADASTGDLRRISRSALLDIS